MSDPPRLQPLSSKQLPNRSTSRARSKCTPLAPSLRARFRPRDLLSEDQPFHSRERTPQLFHRENSSYSRHQRRSQRIQDRKSTRLNSSHSQISYALFFF